MSNRSSSPMEQGEIEASPDLHDSPGIELDPEDDYNIRQVSRTSDKEKFSKAKHVDDSRSPDRHEEIEDALNIQPPQVAHLKKDKHRHHRHAKESHKRSREVNKYPSDNRHRDDRDDRLIRKHEDKSRSKHSKRESEFNSSSSFRDYGKRQTLVDRDSDAIRRQKSIQERERLELLERERHRIEKEKEREYYVQMKKSEQEQANRLELERRRSDRAWKDEERERQNAEEVMKRRERDVGKKSRPRSRTRSRSPAHRANPAKDSEKDARRSGNDYQREESRSIQRHESFGALKDSKQRSVHDREYDREREEQYSRGKPVSGGSRSSAANRDDHFKQKIEERSDESDRSGRMIGAEDHGPEREDARQSSASPDGSEKSDGSSTSGAESDARSHGEQEEEDDNKGQSHSAHDDLRSKFDDDDDAQQDSPDQRHTYSESSDGEEEKNDEAYLDSPIPSSPEEQLQLPPYFPALQGCRNVEEFHCLNRIEEGTYGVVYRAVDLKTEEVVALKRLKMEKEKEGFPITSLREINTLLKAQHPNIVTVREIVVGSNMDKIYIVMDYVEHDLKSLMEYMKEPFSIGEVKTLMLQLLRGVAHLHDNWIIHRDLKTSNLLLSHKGILKIGDFGLAREYGSPLRPYTSIVVTLWYRAPELLMGVKEYSTPIDVWSVGCIFAEFLTRKPLFPGKSEIDELNKIFKELGTPNEKIWPGVGQLPAMQRCTFTDYPYNQLQGKFKTMLTAKGLDLLNRFLTYNPEKRITAEDAKKHEFFTESPLPVNPSMFPTWPAKSEQGRTRTHGNSPKPPSGGKAYAKLLGDDDEYGARFHMGGPTACDAGKSTGFALKF